MKKQKPQKVYISCKSLDLDFGLYWVKSTKQIYILIQKGFTKNIAAATKAKLNNRPDPMIFNKVYSGFVFEYFAPYFVFHKAGTFGAPAARDLKHLVYSELNRKNLMRNFGYHASESIKYFLKKGIQLFIHEHRKERSLCIKVPRASSSGVWYMRSEAGAQSWYLSKLTDKNLTPIGDYLKYFTKEEKVNFKTMLLSGGEGFDTALWLLQNPAKTL